MLLTPQQARIAFQDALEIKYAILAINADSPAAITDCLYAAQEASAPIIIEASLWQLTGRSFGAGDALTGMARYLAQITALANAPQFQKLPVLFHTDHIKGPGTRELLTAAIQGIPFEASGNKIPLFASSISVDSSELTEAQNIQLLCDLCNAANTSGVEVTLEMEAGVDDGITPLDVADRLLGGVEKKYPGNIWLWAPGVGTRHGFSEQGFPAFSSEHIANHRERAREITGREIGIALHGSSGLAPEALHSAVEAGVVKVNWSSESLLVRAQAAQAYYQEAGHKLDPAHPQFKISAMDNGVQSYVTERYIPKILERFDSLGCRDRAENLMLRILA
jgi:fructose/tagatose bisphosphate aldolase